jgi:hypothetical protein
MTITTAKADADASATRAATESIIECALAVANKAQRLMRATDLCGK